MSRKGVAGNSGNLKKKRISRSARAGLIFPVPQVERAIKDGPYSKRVGGTVAVYMAAVMENLCSEMLTSAARLAKNSNSKKITPLLINQAVWRNNELNLLLKDVFIPLSDKSIQKAKIPNTMKKNIKKKNVNKKNVKKKNIKKKNVKKKNVKNKNVKKKNVKKKNIKKKEYEEE